MSAVEAESASKDPDNFLSEYFLEIRRQVDERREIIKAKVDQYSDELLESLKDAEDMCKNLSGRVNQLTTDFENSRKGLKELMEQFDAAEIGEETLKDIQSSADALKNKFKDLLLEYKMAILENKEYVFSYDVNVKDGLLNRHIKNMFGKIAMDEVSY